MTACRSFNHFVEQELGKIPHFLIYAVLEWMLISMLFLDGFLAFLANVFANLFELEPPCLLCTRINHVFAPRDHDYHYNNTMCEGHKKEISSLAYCHVHRKLSDLRTMCEACLLAFASENNANAVATTSTTVVTTTTTSTNTNKDIDCLFDDELRARLKMPGWLKDDPALQGNSTGLDKGSANLCSCCGEPMKVKSSYQKPGFAAIPSLVAHAPTPSPRAAFGPWKNEEAKSMDLPPIKYGELKLPKSNLSSTSAEEDGGNMVNQAKEDKKATSTTIPLPSESEDITEDLTRTPSFTKGNKFFSMVSSDSTTTSPRFSLRTPRKSMSDKLDLAPTDSFDNVGVNEPEDSIVNRLKRQMKLDRKSLIALSKELEEERSASAVAANNAMAMITRLQAEKASVQMEALQYQRMMDEQAEYDQQALSAMHEMLEKREYEMRDMEEELDLYRERYGVLRDVVRRSDRFERTQSFSSFTERSEHEEGGDGHVSPNESVFDIETDVDHDPSLAYYDHAYVLSESEMLPEEEEEEDEEKMDRYGGGGRGLFGQLEGLGSNVLDRLRDQSEYVVKRSLEIGDDSKTNGENYKGNEEENEGKMNDDDGRISMDLEHNKTHLHYQVESSESEIQQPIENNPNEEANDEQKDRDGRNHLVMAKEEAELGREIVIGLEEIEEQVGANMGKAEAPSLAGSNHFIITEEMLELGGGNEGSYKQ